jgi:phospholipid transport system substrate-binding protein
MRRWVASTVALTGVLLLCPDAWAGSPTERLRGFFGSAARILDTLKTREKPEEGLGAIRAIVSDVFDFREAARLSLGPSWSGRTPAEREEFVSLFANLLERSLTIGIAARIHLSDGVKVSYLDESIDGAVATVWTTIVTKSGLDLPFNYRMIERGDRWAVRDVVIDGVSLAANYQAQFLRVIQSASYPELVRQLRARVSPTPMAPLVATAAPGGLAIIQASPPAAMTRTDLPATWPEAPAQTLADSPSQDGAPGARSAPRRQPELVRIALAQPEPGIPAKTAAQEASAKEAPPPAAAPRERRSPPDQVQGATAARLVSARPPGARSYWVQVGAFKNPEAARRLASLLLDEELERQPAASDRSPVVVEAASLDTPLVRVRVGPFSDRSEAASKLREMEARGYKPFIVEYRH